MMMYRNSSLLSHGIPRPPPLPSIPHLPLPPDLLARYSAMQATLGLYNPSFLAAALRSSAPTSIQSQILQPSRPMSPKSRDLSGKPSRFSPYVLPSSRSADSPSHQSTASDGEPRSPSPRSSPPAPPPFSLYRQLLFLFFNLQTLNTTSLLHHIPILDLQHSCVNQSSADNQTISASFCSLLVKVYISCCSRLIC